ncbi:MAG: ABC-type multidrug transport system fused ATPase/permease subunit, partial [Paraglaciecola sp.]
SMNPSQPVSLRAGAFAFESVQFSYPTRPEVEVLRGISFAIKPGEKVALVGHSGAGKSTIAQLMMRYYEPTAGNLSMNGEALQKGTVQDLRSKIGVVPQEVLLFGGTLLENIRYGKPEATMAEVQEAAKKAYALEFIEGFPEGFDTLVGERGVKLSGGQRQRIAIARAILKDPEFLILDEATSALDAESERLVQDALQVLMEGRTTLVIAHRLATIKSVDRIMVLKEGQIIEEGSHQDLLEQKGAYHQFIELQLLAD